MKHNIIATIRTDKKDSKGLMPIYIFIYNPKLTSKISIGEKIAPELWDTDERRVKRKYKHAVLINSKIEKKISELKTKILTEELTNVNVDLKHILKKDKMKDADFYEFAETQIKEKNYAEETRRAYTIYIDKLKEFKKTLKLSEINFQFLQKYEAYLRDELKNSHNTIWGNFKFINTMTNDAIKMKMIAEDPFKTYKRVPFKQTERTFLDAAEIERIAKFVDETEDDAIKIVGKYFLFMAYTGLRYSDAIRFHSTLFVIDGERIVMETQKTKKVTNLFINDRIKPLIDFVDNNRLTITQVDFNRKLKVIAAGAGVKKKVSSHVGRHSFGSSLADAGIPIEIAKGLMSHGSTASTKIYYHIKNSNLDEAMKRFNKVS
ncbi:MAG: integrase family protein [Daejeonella sp.]|nr:integrase family protein [Daejeonella sp.]